MITEAQAKEAIAQVKDPAFDADIVSYRIFRNLEVQGDDVLVRLDIPTHAYPMTLRKELLSLAHAFGVEDERFGRSTGTVDLKG